MAYKPRTVQGKAKGNLRYTGSQYIAEVLPLAPTRMSDEEAVWRRFALLLSYGAFESKFIDIITVTPRGQQKIFRVEAMHMVKQMDGAFVKPRPTGIWRARLVDETSLEAAK